MTKLDELVWTEEELESIHTIANWYGNAVEVRGQPAPDHVLRAVLGVAMETYISNRSQDAMQRAAHEAALDDETVARLTADPATAEEMASVAGLLAWAMGASAGITDHDELLHHRALTVAHLLAQVRLRNSGKNLDGGYVQ